MADNIIAIILGAHVWPRSPPWTSSDNFTKSAQDFREYLLNSQGMRISPANLLYLFDDEREVGVIDDVISSFIEERKITLPSLDTIILYYTGHGAFTDGDQKYCLALRCTRIKALSTSAYRVSSLARTINTSIGDAKKYIILDACYAGAALSDFIPQSDAAERMESNTMDALADTGTALLCAASSADVALTPTSSKHTMFSGALIESLIEGSKNKPETLSFDDIRQMAWAKILASHKGDAVSPEIHIPDQRKGDISKVGLFPNPALVVPHADDRFIGMQRSINALNIQYLELNKKVDLIIGKNISVKNDQNEFITYDEDAPWPAKIPPKYHFAFDRMLFAIKFSLFVLTFVLLLFVLEVTTILTPSMFSSLNGNTGWYSSGLGIIIDSFVVFVTAILMIIAVKQKPFEEADSLLKDTDQRWRWDKYIARVLSLDYANIIGDIVIVKRYINISLIISILSSFISIISFIQYWISLGKIIH